ncbi:MAG: hypothetical protein AB7J34_19860 [Limisphaerales bacterium]
MKNVEPDDGGAGLRKRASSNEWSRRGFLSRVAGWSAAGAVVQGHRSVIGATANRRSRPAQGRRLRVALLATEVRRHSHAQHFIDRLVEGYGWEGVHRRPGIDLASLYVDQFPSGDLARDRSRRHGVPIYPTIAEALTLGGEKLAVDGVLIIAEHGSYPKNEKGQMLYPRYKFFKETVRVFENSGRSVPVFNDKHLSTSWAECAEMVADAKRLDFAFLAGSSLPVTWRIPSVDLPWGTELEESVAVCYGGVDSYDFHGLETAQCMSERRRGGETGIQSVWALRGAAMWAELGKRESTKDLVLSALTRSHTVRPPEGYGFLPPTLEQLQRSSPDAVGYFVEHRDGLRTAMFLMNGAVQDFTYAGRERRRGAVVSCQMHLPMPGHIATTADFFNPLMRHIETTVVTRKAVYPAERTLLTSGMTLAAVDSLHLGQVPVKTPAMEVAYTVRPESTFWRA